MTGRSDVKTEVSAAVEESRDLVQGLAERMGANTTASTVFGEAVEREGVTVIPVAKATWGFGGGSGGEPPDEGSGGGGGSIVSPVGYIEIHPDHVQFKALGRVGAGTVVAAAAAGALGLLVGRYARRR